MNGADAYGILTESILKRKQKADKAKNEEDDGTAEARRAHEHAHQMAIQNHIHQANQQAMMDSQRAANMSASLAMSGGTNPFMFGC